MTLRGMLEVHNATTKEARVKPTVVSSTSASIFTVSGR